MCQRIFVLIFFIVTVILQGCVSQKVYDDLEVEKESLAAEKAELEEKLAITTDRNDRLEKALAGLKQDTSKLGKSLRESSSKLRTLQTQHKNLESAYEEMSQSKGRLDQDLATKQKELIDLEASLDLERQRNEELYRDLEEREAKVSELERILEEKDQAVNNLKNAVSKALLNFKENDLTVEVRNGKVYVSLAEQLLFRSGSVQVDAKGKTALQQLAKVLKTEKDINIMVEGHTDNVRISKTSQYMKDNWDLSVLRATSIIRILSQEGVSADRITASGKGEFNPVADNDSAESRKRNRRTDIILTPKLDELFKILE